MDPKELMNAFYDTRRISTSSILKMQTAKMIRNSKIYGEEFWKGKEKRSNLHAECEIIVEENTSFSAAKKYIPLGKTAVLNFANPVTPGGGVQYGAMAQEECLCRSSNLYEALSSKVMDEYYNYHLEMDSIYASDRLIYSSKVTVFKDDSQVPKLMPKNEWFSVDVITCAAPYNNHADMVYKEIIPDLLKETFKRRIKNIFEAALDNQIEVIILGAFGCGAFRNPPELVASAFHEVIDENQYKKYFSKIVFAIKRSCEPPCPNLMAFEREFLLFSPEGNYERFYM